jgi:aminopeptidase N
MRDDALQPVRLDQYRPPAFLIDEAELDFNLEPKATRVRGRLTARRNGDHAEPLHLDGVGLKAVSLRLDGRALDASEFAIDRDGLTIPNAPDAFVLETLVEIDPEANAALEGLYMSGGRFCTQCEAEGFRKITFFPDRPDVLAKFTVRIEADDRFARLLSNGNLIESGAAGDGGIRGLERSVSQALLPVRSGRRRTGRPGGFLRHDERAEGRPSDLRRSGHGAPGDLRHGLPQARDALGRGELWAANTISTSS